MVKSLVKVFFLFFCKIEVKPGRRLHAFFIYHIHQSDLPLPVHPGCACLALPTGASSNISKSWLTQWQAKWTEERTSSSTHRCCTTNHRCGQAETCVAWSYHTHSILHVHYCLVDYAICICWDKNKTKTKKINAFLHHLTEQKVGWQRQQQASMNLHRTKNVTLLSQINIVFNKENYHWTYQSIYY